MSIKAAREVGDYLILLYRHVYEPKQILGLDVCKIQTVEWVGPMDSHLDRIWLVGIIYKVELYNSCQKNSRIQSKKINWISSKIEKTSRNRSTLKTISMMKKRYKP